MLMIRRIISSIPNAITCCNLISGCVAVYMAFHLTDTFAGLDGRIWTYIFIAAAALFDFCDGASSRILKAYSAIGRELDSLADVVSFGVAPAMLVLNVMQLHSSHPWAAFAAMFIPAMGALRLAIFNVDTTQSTVFKGLPIPANAIFWIGACDWIARYVYPGDVVMIAVIIGVSLLMVCKMRMFSLKFKNFSPSENFARYALIIASVAFVISGGFSGLVWSIAFYVLLSAFPRYRAY